MQTVTKNPNNTENVSSTKTRPVDKYEIQREVLSICNVIGEGAFGVVHKGILVKSPGNPEEVAVKMLRGNLEYILFMCELISQVLEF